MRGAATATAVGAAGVVAIVVAFRFGAWLLDACVQAWFRRETRRASRESA